MGSAKIFICNIDRRRNIYTLDKTDPFENSVADQAQSVAFMIKKLQTDGSGDFLLETVTLAKYTDWADVLLPTTDSTRESDNEDDDRVWSD